MLHIANGTSTTRLIEVAGIPGVRSIWAGPLYEGPVPHGLDDEQLRRARAEYLSGSAGLGPDEVVNDLSRWRRAIEGCDATGEIVLWFEHDLFDQLNLIQLLDWIHGRFRTSQPVESRRPVISLICIGSFAGRLHFRGLGELTPTEIASLFPTRERVTDVQFDLARVWNLAATRRARSRTGTWAERLTPRNGGDYRSGRATLGGRLDRVKACGIDRWLGGVHLTVTGVDWRWEEKQQRVVPSVPRG